MPIILGFALLLLLAAVLVPQLWIRRVFARHGAERPDLPGTGAELARHLLDRAGLSDVKVELTGDGDHYDPEECAVRLLPQHHDGRSVAAVAVAAHEVSHAVQHAPHPHLRTEQDREQDQRCEPEDDRHAFPFDARAAHISS